MEEWERGRACRRSICDMISGGRELRRKEGDPEKDKIFRKLNNGERGLPFASSEELQHRCEEKEKQRMNPAQIDGFGTDSANAEA